MVQRRPGFKETVMPMGVNMFLHSPVYSSGSSALCMFVSGLCLCWSTALSNLSQRFTPQKCVRRKKIITSDCTCTLTEDTPTVNNYKIKL